MNLTELLYDATRTDFGLVVETDDVERLRQKLYAVRKDNPDLKELSFVVSPFNNSDLWILNKGGRNAEG